MNNPKYLTVVHKITPELMNTLNEIPKRGGFFNWLFAFAGEIREFSDEINYDDYDIVHVNMAPIDQIFVPEIRKKLGNNSSTKLVLNNDYVAESWHQWGLHPMQYWHIQEMADMVFGTEPIQVSHMIDKAKVIPHPHDIESLKHFSAAEVEDNYGVIFHWWEGKTYSPAIFALKLRKEFPKLTNTLYGYKEQNDTAIKFRKVFWDKVPPTMNFPEYIDELMSNKFIYEPTSYHTYGRNTVDLAAVGTPMIGTNTVESMRRCFPNTINDPYDIKATLEKAKKLLTDDEFREEVIEYARDQSEYYSYENSKKRFLEALEESE